MLASLRSHYGLLAVVTVFVLLATADNLLVPPFEGADEHRHYAYVRHLAQGRGLPIQNIPVTDLESYGPFQEASQPPLYYALAALVTAWIPGADNVDAALHPNPNFAFPAPVYWPDNKNFWLHSPDVGVMDAGFLLASHIARAISTCMGVVAVVSAYGLGLFCFDGDKPLAACSAAWVAFNPEFVFVSGMVSNDSTAAGIAALVLWVTAMWLVRGPSPGRAIAWGVTLGLAALTKVSLLTIFPVCVVGFWLGVRRERPGWVVGYAAWIVGLALLVAGWWYAHGAALYGDPLSISQHLQAVWARQHPRAFSEQLLKVWHTEHTYWAGFGWGGVQRPDWLGWLVVWWERLGFLGVALYVWRSWRALGRRKWLVMLLTVWLLVCLAAMLWWMRVMKGGLGRLMFPAAGSIGVLLVMGWRGWLPSRWRHIGLGAMTAGLLAFAVAAPLAFIRPAFARPPQLRPAQLATLRESPPVIFGGAARLLAVEVNPEPAYPGGWTWVKVCWESLARLEKDYEVFVHFVGPSDNLVAVRHTHTGLGRFPTSTWQPGDAFCDTVRLKVEKWAPAPAVYDVEVGLYDRERGERLEARNRAGDLIAPVYMGRVKVWAAERLIVVPPHPTNYILGDQIALLGYDVEPAEVQAGEAFMLTLYWRAERKPDADYVAFVHLVDEGGNLVAQVDGPPQRGVYPTSWWAEGDEVVDVRQVVLSTGAREGIHWLVVGLYRWETMERLPVYAGDGTRVPDAAIRLTRVHVVQ